MSGTGRGSYELRLDGLLGPLLLASLPHAAVRLQPRHTVVVTTDDDGLRAVLSRLVDAEVELDSVRQVSPPPDRRRGPGAPGRGVSAAGP